MRLTFILEKTRVLSASFSTTAGAASNAGKRQLKSLALSVYFKQPDLGMKDYEILSRATAFLLGVDPPETSSDDNDSPYQRHLEIARRQRETRAYKQTHEHSPAGGPEGRPLTSLSWLEYVPREVRPQVHVVCSSHVLAPFLWRDYYPHDWLTTVRAEHCAYALEVYDNVDVENEGESLEPLAKFALNPQPFHHPEGRDLALIHLQDEEASLKLMKKLGVSILYMRDMDKLYEKGENMLFDGFVVSERNVADSAEHSAASNQDDNRVFYPYKANGNLSFHTSDRFFATTPEPLPEGLCGAPVLDENGDLCGAVEGIVPVDHKNTNLAGSAAFLPSFLVESFVDYVERYLLEQIMPKDLFQMVETAKKTNSIGGGVFKKDSEGNYSGETNWEEAYDITLAELRKRYSAEEVDAMLQAVERERQEVLELMDKEGGDMDEIIERVRSKTMQIREMIIDQYRKGQGEKEEKEG